MTLLSSFKAIFETLLDLSVDPHTGVALMASSVADYVIALLLDSAFCRVERSALGRLSSKSRPPPPYARQPSMEMSDSAVPPHANGSALPLKRTVTETSFSGPSSLKRNSSVANALRNLASMTGLLPHESSDTPASPQARQKDLDGAENAAGSGAYCSPYPDASHERVMPDGDHALRSTSLGMLHAQVRTRAALGIAPRLDLPSVPAAAVLEALTEEDMERLRIRRQKGTEADGRMTNNGLARSSDLGLGMVAKEVKDDVLPLKSGFFDWATEYYRESQMRVSPEAQCRGKC